MAWVTAGIRKEQFRCTWWEHSPVGKGNSSVEAEGGIYSGFRCREMHLAGIWQTFQCADFAPSVGHVSTSTDKEDRKAS